MTLIIQKSHMVHLGDITHLVEDHTEDEWRYLVDIKFTKPYHKAAFEVMIGTGLIWIKPTERLLTHPMKHPLLRMFAMYNDKCLEVGECYIAEIPIKWEVLKDMTEIQLLFIREGRKEFMESIKSKLPVIEVEWKGFDLGLITNRLEDTLFRGFR